MTKIVILTKEEHRLLYGQEFTKDMTFNPFLDPDGNICISEQEVNQCNIKEFEFIKSKTLVEQSEVLKTDWTKEQWLTYEKAEAEKRALELQAELDKIKKPIKK